MNTILSAFMGCFLQFDDCINAILLKLFIDSIDVHCEGWLEIRSVFIAGYPSRIRQTPFFFTLFEKEQNVASSMPFPLDFLRYLNLCNKWETNTWLFQTYTSTWSYLSWGDLQHELRLHGSPQECWYMIQVIIYLIN